MTLRNYADQMKAVGLIDDDVTKEGMAQLAARTRSPRVGQSMISRLEGGTRLSASIDVVRSLEKALGVHAGVLLGAVPGDTQTRSLERFLASTLAGTLNLTSDEIEELHRWEWFGPNEEPDVDAWYDFIRLRRRIRTGR